MNEQYLQDLYEWIKSNDPSYGDDFNYNQFKQKMQDEKYASEMHSWISSIDNTFEQDKPLDAFLKTIKIPSTQQPMAQEQQPVKKKEAFGDYGVLGYQQTEGPIQRSIKEGKPTESLSETGSLESQKKDVLDLEYVMGTDIAKKQLEQKMNQPIAREEYLADKAKEFKKEYEFKEEYGIREAETKKLKAQEDIKAKEEEARLKEEAIATSQTAEFLDKINKIDKSIYLSDDKFNELKNDFKQYGIVLEKSGFFNNKIVARTEDGKRSISLDASPDNLEEMGLGPESLKKFIKENNRISQEEDFLSKALRARNMRSGFRINEDGTTSTVKFVSFDNKVIPTLFPKNPLFPTTFMGNWVELPFEEALKEAQKRGEVFTFKTEKEAQDFAAGSWKDISKLDIEGDNFYRSKGKDYITEKRRWERYDEIDGIINFFEGYDKKNLEEFQKENPSLFVNGKWRTDMREVVSELKKERESLRPLVKDFTFYNQEGTSEKLRMDFDAHLAKLENKAAAEATKIVRDVQTNIAEINQTSVDLYGIPIDELIKKDNKQIQNPEAYNNLIQKYNDAVQLGQLATTKYAEAKTFFDAKINKEINNELTENFEATFNAWNDGIRNGLIGDQLLALTIPGYTSWSGFSDKESASKYIAEKLSRMTDTQSRTMTRLEAAKTYRDWWDVMLDDPLEAMSIAVSGSISQMLPYGVKIIPAITVPSIGIGAATGLLGGPFAPVTVSAGAATGLSTGLKIGQAVTGYATEYTNAVMEAVRKYKYNPLDPQSLEKALSDQRVWDDAAAVGLARGIPIAAVDYLSAGLAGRIVKPASKLSSAATKMARGTVENVVVDPLMESGGETIAQLSEITFGTGRRELNLNEIALEGIGGMGSNTPNYVFNTYLATKDNVDINLAYNLTDLKKIANENVSDERISNWANNMEKLGKIDASVNQRIQENVGLRRTAKEVLSVGGQKGRASSDVTARTMELLSAKEQLTSTKERQEVYGKEIRAINEELAAIGKSKQLLPSEQQVDLEGLVEVAPESQREAVGEYMIDGRRYTKQQFLDKIDSFTPERLSRAKVAVKGDPEVTQTFKEKVDAIQKQTTGEVSLQPETEPGKEMETGGSEAGPEAAPKQGVLSPEESKRKEELLAAFENPSELESFTEGVPTPLIKVNDAYEDKAGAQAELDALLQKEQRTPEVPKQTTTDIFTAAPTKTRQAITFTSPDGIIVSLDGNEQMAAQLYDEAIATPEEQRSQQQNKIVEKMQPLVTAAAPAVEVTTTEVTPVAETTITTEAAPVQPAETFTEQDKARQQELTDALAKADKRRKNITVGETVMTKADVKAELDALNQKELSSQQPAVEAAPVTEVAPVAPVAPVETAPVQTLTPEQEADKLEQMMLGKMGAPKVEAAPVTEVAPTTEGKVETESEKTAKRIRGKKMKGTLSTLDFGITQTVYNGALEFMARQVESGTKIGEAITATINWIDTKVGNIKWDKESFSKYINTAAEEKDVKYAEPVFIDGEGWAIKTLPNKYSPLVGISVNTYPTKELAKVEADKQSERIAQKIASKEGMSLSDAVRGLKIKGPGGLQSNILGVPIAIWNAAMDTVAKAIDAGVALSGAVQKGYDYIKDRHKAINKERFENKVLIGMYSNAIQMAREGNISDAGIKTYLTRKGLTESQADALLKIKPKAEKKPISKEKIIGKPKPKKVTVNEMTALKDQIRLEARAAREAKGDLNTKRKMLAAAIKDMVKKGKITTRQSDILINRVNTVNLDNPVMVERLLAYAEKVFNDADYADKLSKANDLQSDIKKLSRNTKKFGNLTPFAAEFAKIDPAMVENIDEYIEMASKVKEGVQGSKIVGENVIPADMVDVGKTMEYVNKMMEAQAETIRKNTAERLQELMGVDASDLTYDQMMELLNLSEDEKVDKYKEGIIRGFINKMFNTYSTIINDMFETGIDPFSDPDNPTTVEFKESDKKIVEEFMAMDLSLLDAKEALRAADALNNFIVNKSIAGMGNVLATYNGVKNVKEVDAKGVRSKEIKMYFSPAIGRLFFEQFASVPLFFERLFKGFKAGEYVREKMGINSLINHKAEALDAANRVINKYVLQFTKMKPNKKSFQDMYNIIERGIIGDLAKTIVGDEKQVAAEFNRRKKLIEESIEVLNKGGTKKETEAAKVIKEVYDKIARDANNIAEVKAKADKINVDAVQFWVDEWAKLYDQFADVALSVYNKVLDKNVNYVPDRFGFLERDDKVKKDTDGTESLFFSNSNTENFYKKEAGSLMKSTPPTTLLSGKANMYVNLSFDTNNANALLEALIDIKTAADIRQIQAFKNSPEFENIIPSGKDASLTKDRIATLIRNIRNKRIITDKVFRDVTRKLDRIAGLGTALALAGPTQAISQTVPVAVNTLVNSVGNLKLSNLHNKAVNDFINNSGMAIANRGVEATTELETLNQKLEAAATAKTEKVARFIENINRKYLKIYLSNFDVMIARASWIAYYEQYLKKQKEYPKQGIDYSNHEMNKEAAQYAQDMVDRQQNISDKDLAGKMYQSDNPLKQLITKIAMPLSTFRMNQTTRFSNDLAVLSSKTASNEDKAIARRSLGGFAAEMATFRLVKLYIGYYVFYSIAQFIRGEEDDEEEKKKKWDNMVKGAATSVTTDVLSPAPFADIVARSGFSAVLDKVQEFIGTEEEDRYNIFTDQGKTVFESFISDLGILGIAADKATKLYENIKLGVTSKFTDNYGNEKTIMEKDRELLSNPLYIALGITTTLGINPFSPETNNVMNTIVKSAKKDAMTGEQLKEYQETGRTKSEAKKYKAERKAMKEEAYGGYKTLEEFEKNEPEKFDEYSARGGKLYKYKESERLEEEEKNKDKPFRGLSEKKFKELYPREWRENYGPGTEYFREQNTPEKRRERAMEKREEAKREMLRKRREVQDKIRERQERYGR